MLVRDLRQRTTSGVHRRTTECPRIAGTGRGTGSASSRPDRRAPVRSTAAGSHRDGTGGEPRTIGGTEPIAGSRLCRRSGRRRCLVLAILAVGARHPRRWRTPAPPEAPHVGCGIVRRVTSFIVSGASTPNTGANQRPESVRCCSLPPSSRQRPGFMRESVLTCRPRIVYICI